MWGITHRIHENTTIYVCHQTIFKLIPNFDEVFRFVTRSSPTDIT